MWVRLKGIATATKILAGGKRVQYYYAWRGGPRLDGEYGSADFKASYDRALAQRKRAPKGTLQSLIHVYKSSTEFLNCAPRTQADYLKQIEKIEADFRSMPISALADKRARGVFKAWRDRLAIKSLRQADYAWTVLARIFSVAKDRGLVDVNPCERGGRFYKADRAEIIWSNDDIKAFGAVASDELILALFMALWTGQRQGDLLKLRWLAYDGKHIRLRQSKGGKRVKIPVHSILKARLDHSKSNVKSLDQTILITSRGKSWTEGGFGSSWGKAFIKSGLLTDLHFHDLRGTAVTRLALAGCSVPQIAAITGHSLKDVQAILDAHYLGGTEELAEAAMLKLESMYGERTESANQLQTSGGSSRAKIA